MDSEELAALRTEVAAASEAVKLTGQPYRKTPNRGTKADADATMSHWRRSSDLLYAAIEEHLRLIAPSDV